MPSSEPGLFYCFLSLQAEEEGTSELWLSCKVTEMEHVLHWPCPSVQFSGTKVIYHIVQPL